MNGIHAAFTGRIGKDAEVRTASDGKPWASFPVAVDAKTDGEARRPWVRGALFGDTVGTVAPRLTKGTQVYCEGRLSLGTWTGRDGDARAGLNLAAREVQPMGQIGRRKPKARPRDEHGAHDDDRWLGGEDAGLDRLWRVAIRERGGQTATVEYPLRLQPARVATLR